MDEYEGMLAVRGGRRWGFSGGRGPPAVGSPPGTLSYTATRRCHTSAR